MLQLTYTFADSANTVFDAWITKPVAELWLFKNDTNDLQFKADSDGFSIDEQDGDKQIGHWAKYLKIERPHTLQFTLEVPAHFEGVSEVMLQIQETPAGTQLVLTQKNIDTSITEGPWRKMIERLTTLLQKPYTITIQSNGYDVIQAIMVVAMQIVGLAREFDEATFNKVPFKNSWTMAQLIRHVQKMVTGSADLLAKPLEPAKRDPAIKILPLKQSFLDITHKMQSPDFIVPETKHFEKDRLIREFEMALSPLVHVKNVGWNELITGLPLGDVTKLEIIHFMLYHLQRHLIQMRGITGVLRS